MRTATSMQNSVDGVNEPRSIADEVAELKDTFRSGVHDTTDSGKRVVHAVSTAAAQTVRSMKSSATRSAEKAASCIAERPFTAVAIALGIGAVVGAGLMWRRR